MTRYVVLLGVALGLTIGCSGGRYGENGDSSVSSSPESTATRGEKTKNPQLVSHAELPREVVKTGALTLEVDRVDVVERKARSAIEALGGRADKVESTDLAGPRPTLSMSFRIPVAMFDQAMEQLEGLGSRTAKQVSVEDVTAKVVDMDARLKTMRSQEQALRNMLNRAKAMDESLAINRQLMDLRGEIESMMAQRKSLAGQAAFSTIQVTLTQKANVEVMAATDPNWLQNAWMGAWSTAMGSFRLIVSILIWLLVFSPLWIVAILAVRKIARTGHPSKV